VDWQGVKPDQVFGDMLAVFHPEVDQFAFNVTVMGVTSLHSRLVLGRDSNKELSSIRAKGTSKGFVSKA